MEEGGEIEEEGGEGRRRSCARYIETDTAAYIGIVVVVAVVVVFLLLLFV